MSAGVAPRSGVVLAACDCDMTWAGRSSGAWRGEEPWATLPSWTGNCQLPPAAHKHQEMFPDNQRWTVHLTSPLGPPRNPLPAAELGVHIPSTSTVKNRVERKLLINLQQKTPVGNKSDQQRIWKVVQVCNIHAQHICCKCLDNNRH